LTRSLGRHPSLVDRHASEFAQLPLFTLLLSMVQFFLASVRVIVIQTSCVGQAAWPAHPKYGHIRCPLSVLHADRSGLSRESRASRTMKRERPCSTKCQLSGSMYCSRLPGFWLFNLGLCMGGDLILGSRPRDTCWCWPVLP